MRRAAVGPAAQRGWALPACALASWDASVRPLVQHVLVGRGHAHGPIGHGCLADGSMGKERFAFCIFLNFFSSLFIYIYIYICEYGYIYIILDHPKIIFLFFLNGYTTRLFLANKKTRLQRQMQHTYVYI